MLYIGTSTQFQLHFVNRDALEQLIGSNRIDTVFGNGIIAPRKSKHDEAVMMGIPADPKVVLNQEH